MSYIPGSGAGAPKTATYITQTADGTLSSGQALSALATGLVKVTSGTGVLGTASASDLPRHTHAQSDVTNLVADLSGKAASSHTHAQSDITNLTTALSGKAATSHSHAQSDIANLTADLSGKAASSHTHAQGDITNLVTALSGKAASSHTHASSDLTTDVPLSGIAAASAESLLLGRGQGAGGGDFQEITLGTNLSLSGTTLNATGGAAGPWTTYRQIANNSKTDNALTASAYMRVTLAGATQYTIRGVAYLLVQNAAADARYDINYSGSWTTVYCRDSRNVAGVAAGTDARTDRMAAALPGSTDMAATVAGVCIVQFELTGLTNAGGTLAFRFAQVTNNASATLLSRGSYMEVMTA